MLLESSQSARAPDTKLVASASWMPIIVALTKGVLSGWVSLGWYVRICLSPATLGSLLWGFSDDALNFGPVLRQIFKVDGLEISIFILHGDREFTRFRLQPLRLDTDPPRFPFTRVLQIHYVERMSWDDALAIRDKVRFTHGGKEVCIVLAVPLFRIPSECVV